MDFSRRSILAGAAGLPLAPAPAETFRAKKPRFLILKKDEPVSLFVAYNIRTWFDVDTVSEAFTVGEASALMAHDASRFDLAFWREGGEQIDGTLGVFSTAHRRLTSDGPFYLRQMSKAVRDLTGWKHVRARS